ISDHVIILNRGELIAQGPIETLLNDGGQPTYHVTVVGAAQSAVTLLKQQEWISQIHGQAINGLQHWQITVSDDDCARRNLLRLILKDEGVQVLKFGQDSAELEDVFMQLVNGEEQQ